MKLTCPNCSARYEVNLPGLTGREVRVKCVKCNTKFLVNSVEDPLAEPRKPEPVSLGASLGSEETHADDENKPPAAPLRKQPEPARSAVSDEAPAMPEAASSNDKESTLAKSSPLPSGVMGAEAGEPMAEPLETPKEIPSVKQTGEAEEFSGDTGFGDGLDSLVFDQDAPELEPAMAEESTAGGKDDLDDLLDQILEGKLSDTQPAPASAGPSAAMDDILMQDVGDEDDLTPRPLFPGEQEMGKKNRDTGPEEMPFLDDQENEGKSEVDRWAEAFAAEGLDHSMEEELGSLDLPGEYKESRPPEEQKTADRSQALEDEAKEIADEMAILNRKTKPQENKDEAEPASAGRDRSALLARKKKGLGLPATRGGKTVLYGLLLALGLAAGGAYMLRETLLPGELLNFRSEPEARARQSVQAVRNKPVAAEAPVETAALPPKAPETPEANSPAKEAVKPEPRPEKNAANDEKPQPAQEAEPVPEVVKELAALAESKGDEGLTSEPSEGLAAALSPRQNAVTLSTIMPVAYSASEIRILSFNLVMELTDEESADAVRQALPVFENATMTTVDTMFENKFFNDILYVKEKLRTNLKTAYNDIIVGGRVKRVHFEDFLIQ